MALLSNVLMSNIVEIKNLDEIKHVWMLKIEFVSEIQPQKSWPRTSLASRRNLSNQMLFNAGKSTERDIHKSKNYWLFLKLTMITYNKVVDSKYYSLEPTYSNHFKSLTPTCDNYVLRNLGEFLLPPILFFLSFLWWKMTLEWWLLMKKRVVMTGLTEMKTFFVIIGSNQIIIYRVRYM